MKLVTIATTCLAISVATGPAVVSASSADTSNLGVEEPFLSFPPAFASTNQSPSNWFRQPAVSTFAAATPFTSVNTPYTDEITALARKGISPARAARAIRVQGRVAQRGIVEKIEAATGASYGGAWFEPTDARLRIGVTSPASRRAADEVIAREGLTDDVTLTPVRSTWTQLQGAQKLWNQRLANLLAHEQVMTSLSAEHNAIYVTLSSSVPAPERTALKQEASTANVNVIVTLIPGRLGIVAADNHTECKRFAEKEAFCNKPITSGVSIGASNEEINYECTAGPLAIPRANVSATYLLTAGHCIRAAGGENITWYSWYKGGLTEEHPIGKAKAFEFGLLGDYGEIPVEEAAWKEAGNEPVYAVTAEWKADNERSYSVIREGRSAEKTTVCHDGQVTGGTCGESLRTGLTARVEGTNVEGLVEVEAPTLKCQKGDSGGPFFFAESNLEVIMEGIAVGVSPTDEHLCFYEPIHTALEELNLELLTKNNENRLRDKEEKEKEEKPCK